MSKGAVQADRRGGDYCELRTKLADWWKYHSLPVREAEGRLGLSNRRFDGPYPAA